MTSRTADRPKYDVPDLARWAASIKGAIESAASAWANYRGKKDPAMFNLAVDEIKNICVFMRMTARELKLDLTPFKSAETSFEDFQIKALSGRFDISKYGPSDLGKMTLALRDMRMAARELIGDVRDLRTPSDSSYDYLAYGADLGIIAGSLVLAAKALRADPQGPVKMRNALSGHFQHVSDNAFESVPPGPPAVEVPAESIVFAAWAKRASIEARRNPAKAVAMLDGLLKATER